MRREILNDPVDLVQPVAGRSKPWVFELLLDLRAQYFFGLIINLVYVLLLYSSPTSYANMQLPEGTHANNLWMGSDVMTYVQPARNFLAYGVFGNGLEPDYHRTMGYPLIIAAFIKVFGNHWPIALIFAQAFFCALVYPALTKIGTVLFERFEVPAALMFVFLFISGAYIVGVPLILTDTVFAVCFILGVCFGLQGIIGKSWKFVLLHIAFLGYAAQIRPILGLYPILNLLLLWALARKKHLAGAIRTKFILGTCTLALLLLCNVPGIRSYINYGVLSPCDVMASNMLDVLGREVLIRQGKTDEYETMREQVEGAASLGQRMSMQQRLGLNIYERYPLTTFKVLCCNALGVICGAHWNTIAAFWGYNGKDLELQGHMPLKGSRAVRVVSLVNRGMYLVVCLLCIILLAKSLRGKNALVALAILGGILYILVPTLIAAAGSRMRLPVDGFLVMFAFRQAAGALSRTAAFIWTKKGTRIERPPEAHPV